MPDGADAQLDSILFFQQFFQSWIGTVQHR